jgi:cytoskeletal protein CcmA (bactofilin family)
MIKKYNIIVIGNQRIHPIKFFENQISIIHRNCRMEGQVYSNGHLIVQGTIKGTIQGESIFTEKGSHVAAHVRATSLRIAGSFVGEIEADTLTILKTANVEGHIRCHRLIIDEGGILNGNVKFITPDYPPQNLA